MFKRFFISFIIAIVFISSIPVSFAEDALSDTQNNLERQERKYETKCSKKTLKNKFCRSLKKKIDVLKKRIARQEKKKLEIANIPTEIETLRKAVIDITNEERKKEGLSPLSVNLFLEKAAQGHTNDMQRRDYIAHESPEGKTALDRIKTAGYLDEFFFCNCNSRYTVGENLAKGQITPEEVISGWMTSEEHRKNILNSEFRDIGIGVTKLNPDINKGNWEEGSYFWAQNFGNVQLDR